MKAWKTLAAALLALALCLGIGCGAYADNSRASAPDRLDGDRRMERRLDVYGIEPAALSQPVTGEKHAIDADTCMTASELYKLPLCMYLASGDAITPPRALPLLPTALVGLFLLLGLFSILVLSFRYKARFLPLLLSLLVSAAAMLLAVVGLQEGTIYAKPNGDPQACVTAFFDAVCAGDYDRAYEQLRDYSDLGLAAQPSTPAGQQVYQALHKSFSYALEGECRTDKLDAEQSVRFTYLNLPAMEEDVAAETKRQIEQIVAERPISAVYDENKRYRPEVTEEAYLAALDQVLAKAETYYAEESMTLSLTYTDGRWQLLTSPALLRALNGGTAI